MSASECHFTVNGYRLAAKEWHKGARFKVIACHGWLDNAASFDVLAPLMTDCHIIALDMPGHGHSDHKSPQATYNIWDDLLDILAIADEMGWSQFALLGHSRGAIMSLLLSAVMPERITAAVLLDAMLPKPVDDGAAAQQLRQFLLDQRGSANKKIADYPSVEKAVAARCLVTGMSEHAASLIVSRALQQVGGRHRWRSDPRLSTASAFKLTEGHQHSLLDALTVPALLLVAEEGLANQKAVLSLADSIASMQYQCLPGGHHFHMESQAAQIAELAERFFQSCCQ